MATRRGSPRRKRCLYCDELFWPDRRTASRQRTCAKAACQQSRRRDSQRRWRLKHPDDALARRYREAVAAAKAGQLPAQRDLPAWARAFPWEEMQDEIPPEVLVALRFFGEFAVERLKDLILADAAESKEIAAHAGANCGRRNAGEALALLLTKLGCRGRPGKPDGARRARPRGDGEGKQ